MNNKEEISLVEKKVLEKFYGMGFDDLTAIGTPDQLLLGIKDNVGLETYDSLLKEATLEIEQGARVVETTAESVVRTSLDGAATAEVSLAEKKVLEKFYGMSFDDLAAMGTPDQLILGIKDNVGLETYDSLLKEATLEVEGKGATITVADDVVEVTSSQPKKFEDFCPDIMQNEKAARWIESEGDKARVFAVKMAGLRDNPNVSPKIKEIISTPEGMMQLYDQIDVKFKDLEKNEEALYNQALKSNNLEDFKKLEKYQSYSNLMKNDAVVLSSEHWEQCYRTTSQAEGTLLETLEDETRIYEQNKLALQNASRATTKPTPESGVIKNIEDQAEQNAAKLEQRIAVHTDTNVTRNVINQTATKTADEAVVKVEAATAKFETRLDKVNAKSLENFVTLADVKGKTDFEIFRGGRNFYSKYDLSKARVNGGAVYGLGQYFTTKENWAYGYAGLGDVAYLSDGENINGEAIAKQKVVYSTKLKAEDMQGIVICEKFTDENYDFLIKEAEKQGKSEITQSLKAIKTAGSDRYIDFYQWLRDKKNVEFMSSLGINGVYNEKAQTLTVYDTSRMNLKVKEAVVLSGTEIPSNLITDESVIKVQKAVVSGNGVPDIQVMSGKELKVQAGKPGGTGIVAKFEAKTPTQEVTNTAKKTVVRTATPAAKKGIATSGKTPLKEVLKNQAKEAWKIPLQLNNTYDKWVDDMVSDVMKWNAPRGVKNVALAVDKASGKVVNNKVTRAGVQQLEKASAAFAKTKSGQKIAKKLSAAAAKLGGEAAMKSALKKVPLLCVAMGVYFAGERLMNGQYVKAVGEVLSGLVGNVPIYGTGASLGLDSAMLADDLKQAGFNLSPEEAALLLKEGLSGERINAEHNPYAAETTNIVNPYKQLHGKTKYKNNPEVREAAKRDASGAGKKAMEDIGKPLSWRNGGR